MGRGHDCLNIDPPHRRLGNPLACGGVVVPHEMIMHQSQRGRKCKLRLRSCWGTAWRARLPPLGRAGTYERQLRRVVEDVLANTLQFRFTSNDVLVVVAFPD